LVDPVLILNANFEPINVCNMRRAIGLILSERAKLVANGRGEVHTCRQSFPRPSIIRLSSIIHRPRPVVKLIRREIFRRDNYICQYCKKATSTLTIDHVIPRHLGGLHIWENVVAACPACNHRKGGRTLAEANMHLLRFPKKPPSSAYYIFSHYLKEYEDWEPYLSGW
jgi:5-methylcytosine-specific restriction endonuclease McrA